MTAVLAMLTALGPISTDSYLPSLPEIMRVMATDVAGAQATLSAFLFGFAAGQVFWGPVSDRYGRKPVLLVGLVLFVLATLACTLAASIEQLIAARCLQAVVASGPIVLGRAMVRDLYDGSRAGGELARMGMIMGLVPAVAPAVGGLLQDSFGWRSTFLASLVFALGLCLIVATMLPETIRVRSQEALSPIGILRGFAVLLRSRAFRVYVALAALAYGGLFAFISGSSFVLIGVYGLTPVGFGLSFGCAVFGYIVGTLVAQRLVRVRRMDDVIAVGVVCLAAGGLIMLACVATRWGGVSGVIGPMALYACGVGLVMLQCQAAAMLPFLDRAGAASSLLGLCQMLFAACVGLVTGAVLGDGAVALPAIMSTLGVVAFGLFCATRRARTQ